MAGTTDSAWVQSIGTERINAAEYNSAFAADAQQIQTNTTGTDPSLSLRTSPQTGVAISNEGSNGITADGSVNTESLTMSQVLQQAIADMSNRPMDPKSYNALFSYKNQLQHTETTRKLLNQKREILRQQKAAGEQTWQTELDIKTLEKKLVSEQGKLQKKMRDPALQQVVDKTAMEMQRQQALAVEHSRNKKLDIYRTNDKINADDPTLSPKLDDAETEETQHAEATRQKRAETVKKNRISGQAFEDARFSEFEAISINLEKQITIKVGSIKVHVDAIGYIRNEDGTYSLQILEFKSTKTARMTKNQRKAFPKIAKEGGVVVGKGKGIFTEGTVIPPGTVVTIIRGAEGGNWYVSDRFG